MTMAEATVRVLPDHPLGTISRHLYGHFAEHLGRCIEEGLWVGEGSDIPNDAGLRRDTTAALKAIGIPIVRWPGGCFADAYDWRDGVGPREQRPRRVNVWWNREEDNQFGTDEFLRLCAATGAAPYICANVGSGTPREMMQWLEYCNHGGDTTLARQRAANGHPEPYGVKYWGIGNENWGCGGAYDAAEYAREYRRYATYLQRLDPGLEFIACGFNHEWNLEFLEEVKQLGLINHLSLHHYYSSGPARGFTEEQYYQLFPNALKLDGMIQRDAELLSFFERGLGRIRLAVDEWGVWHPEADRGLHQENTLRDAVCAAMLFDVFNRHCRVLSMTNIAQTVNVLQCLIQTAGEQMWLTPTYHVYDLYRPHMDATAVATEVECAAVATRQDDRAFCLGTVSASASAQPDSLCVTLSNLHYRETAEVSVVVAGVEKIATAQLRLLSADEADAVNGPEAPQAVCPRPAKLSRRGNRLTCTLPPHSTAAITCRL
jgi:alpha-L-arabinofuranosidase